MSDIDILSWQKQGDVWCFSSVFSSSFLLISKYNCGARNGKHIPLALCKGDLSRVVFIYVLACWDLWESLHGMVFLAEELLHGYVLTFKIHLFGIYKQRKSCLMVWYSLPWKWSVSSCLWKVFLWRKRWAGISSGCWLRANAMHCMNCIKMRFSGLSWAILMIWLFTIVFKL